MQKGNPGVTCDVDDAPIGQLIAHGNERVTVLDTRALFSGSALVAGILAASNAYALAVEIAHPDHTQPGISVQHLAVVASIVSTPSGSQPSDKATQLISDASALSIRDTERTMNVEEYELYRAHLLRQIENVAPNGSEAKDKENPDAEQAHERYQGSGYGQGYRARHRHGMPDRNVNRTGSAGAGGGK
jgi:hypothetical protein